MRRFSVLRVTFDWLTVILIMLAGSGVSISLFASTTTAQAAASEAPIATTLTCTGNLLTNPSFENGVTGWSKTSGDTFASSTSYVADGSYSAYLYRVNGNPAYVWQDINLGSNAGGQTFSLSFYSGTHDPSYSHTAKLDFFNASGTYIGSSTSVAVNNDVDIAPYTVQQYSLSGVAPANTYQVRVVFANSGDYMKLDAGCLTKSSQPAATPTSTATAIASACTGNLVSNPGFESDLNGASPAGWYGAGKVGVNYTGFSTQDGVQFAYVTGNQRMWYPIASTAGKSYRAAFYSGAHNPNPTQKVRLTLYDASMNVLAQSVHTIVTDMEVLGKFGGLYTLDIGPAPTGTTELRFEVTDGGNDYAKIDGVCLRETTKATATPTATATATNTNTPVPPTATATNTNTPVPPTATATNTNTPVPPTATATKTNTPVPPTATATKTNTPVPPTATATNTNTPVPPTATATKTNTPVPPTATATKTNTPVPPTATATKTNTPVPPTATATKTNTPVPPTATATKTNTPVPPTATATKTNTPVPPTATATNTPQPKYAALGNQVWYDLNNNGIQDPSSESYVPGVTVELLLGCTGNTVLNTLVTDNNGYYLFTKLDSGQYRVRFSNLPAGYTFTAQDQGTRDTHDSDADTTGVSQCVTLATSENNQTVDAGIVLVPPTATPTNTNTPVPPTATATKTNTPVPPTATATNTPQPKYAALGNQVWYDLNNNGIQDPSSEPFVPGVTVELLLGCTGNTVLNTLVTDGNGYYLFTKLDSGQYRVRFSNLPAGYTFTAKDQGTLDTHDSDADTTGMSQCVTLATSENNQTVDAGIVLVPPTATPTNTNTAVPPTATPTNTNTPVPPTATPTNTNTPVPPTATATNTNTPVPPTATATSTNTPVPPTATPTNTPLPKLGSIGNQVWFDVNGNGIQDDGVSGVANVKVELLQGCSGTTVIATLFTDSNGNYTFTNLPAGDYRVQFSNLPAGYQFTGLDLSGIEQNDSDAGMNGVTNCIKLAAGENNPDVDAGIVIVTPPTPTPIATPALASLGNYVWEDANKNGLQDSKEIGVKNITVQLLDANGAVVKTATTDANGYYLFEQLQPGAYSVRFTTPANYTSTVANQGKDDAIDSDADPISHQTEVTTLVAGENDLSWDYGIYLSSDVESPKVPASLGNLVWQDFDQNGQQNDGEKGIGGVTVNLYDSQGTLITTTVTDANGVYWFHHLQPGGYIVEFVPQSGFMMTKDNVGDDAFDSDVTGTNNRTPVITLAEGEINQTIDAGIIPIPTGSEGTNEPLSARIFLPLVVR